MTREEELELGSYQAYPSKVEYSSVGDCLVDYNAEHRHIWLAGARWADETLMKRIKDFIYYYHFNYTTDDKVTEQFVEDLCKSVKE